MVFKKIVTKKNKLGFRSFKYLKDIDSVEFNGLMLRKYRDICRLEGAKSELKVLLERAKICFQIEEFTLERKIMVNLIERRLKELGEDIFVIDFDISKFNKVQEK